MNIPFIFDSGKVLDIQDLIPRLPDELLIKFDRSKELTTDEESFLTQAKQAAENSSLPILSGIAAIGELLAISADEVRRDTISDIGWLIQSLGLQAVSLDLLRNDANAILKRNEELKPTNTRVMS